MEISEYWKYENRGCYTDNNGIVVKFELQIGKLFHFHIHMKCMKQCFNVTDGMINYFIFQLLYWFQLSLLYQCLIAFSNILIFYSTLSRFIPLQKRSLMNRNGN